jgi:hypothetical protein
MSFPIEEEGIEETLALAAVQQEQAMDQDQEFFSCKMMPSFG